MLTYNERQEIDSLIMDNVKPRILVVDDNPKNLQYATKILIEAGYDVSVAQNGTNAINYILKSNPPDLILLDVMMPGLSGYEVCEKLKSYDSLKDIPIIFLTAKSETEDIVKGFELGGVDYISKPFQPKEILVRIKTQIDLVKTKKQLEYKNRLLDNFNKNLIEQVQKRTSELSSTKNDLEKFKSIKSEFLAQISHEIRTPINVIINYLNLIQMDKEGEGIKNEDNELYYAINSASRRLIRTIEMIVTMSELQQNIYQIDKKPVLIFRDILEPLVETYKKEAQKKGLLLQIENNAFIQNVYIDKDSIIQVLDNVLDNAVKYTKIGSVNIIIHNDTEDTLLISVADTGIGIAEKYLDNIYKPFTQEDEGYTRRFEGNGLGLAISKRFCDLNDVTFNIKTKKNAGTTVTLIFKLEI